MAVESEASNLVEDDTNGHVDVFVHEFGAVLDYTLSLPLIVR